MAKKEERTLPEIEATNKLLEKEKRQKKKLEKLGFIQMMFDFYTSPIV